MNIFSRVDERIIHTVQKLGMPAARLAIFIVYFWFGILKLFGTSPANPLVSELLSVTMPFPITFEQFILVLGIYEMVIGIAFLIPRLERFAILLLIPHLIVTTMPLILLRADTWQSFLVPTLEGQYIIKNLLIVAVALGIAAHLNPVRTRQIR